MKKDTDQMKTAFGKARQSMGYGKGNNAGMKSELGPATKKNKKRPPKRS